MILGIVVFLLPSCAETGDGDTDPVHSVSLMHSEQEEEASGTEAEEPEPTKTPETDPEGQDAIETSWEEISSAASATEPQPNNGSETGFRLENLSDRSFYFSSGVGAWSTELHIHGDGTFEGNYHDADMGDIGDGYPEGTMYSSIFTGSFEGLEKLDDFTYSLELTSLEFKQIPDTEEILGGVRWIYSTAYGLDGGTEFHLYLPGAPISELPEEYLRWVGYHDAESISGTELPYYGLYNVSAQTGFSSAGYVGPSLLERVDAEISAAAELSEQLEAELQEASTQTDMNLISTELFQTWDKALNAVWKLLEADLGEEAMEALRAEEREWIARKEELVTAAGMEYDDGSMQPMAEAIKAAELTKERVYELVNYAK